MNRRRPLAGVGVAALMTAALLSATASSALAATPVHVDDDGVCAGQSPCYTTIQAGIDNAGPAPAVVRVFPGTYVESVDVSQMGSAIAEAAGSLTMRTVNASNDPATGTATIAPASGAAIHGSIPGSLTIIGFEVSSATTGAVSVSATEVELVDVGSTASGDDSIAASGSVAVTVRRASATGSSGLGFDIQGGATAVVTVVDSRASGNASGGWNINFPYGSDSTVVVRGSSGDNNAGGGWNINHGDNGDVTISDSSGDGNGGSGWNVNFGDSGPVAITGVRASHNGSTGLNVNFGGSGTVSLADVVAGNNGGGGVNVNNGSTVTAEDVVTDENEGQGLHVGASGAVTILDATSRENTKDGFRVDTPGSTTVSHVTALRNGHEGIDVTNAATVSGAWVQGHVDEAVGVELGSGSVMDSIVCENEDGTDGAATAVGIWWGSATGPTVAGNPGGTGDTTDAADFRPFIATIGKSADAARRGDTGMVRFTFTGGARTLAAAPGSRTGPMPFRVSTDNGTLQFGSSSGSSVAARLNASGVLAVSLRPSRAGTATVTVHGPCGLDTRIVVSVSGGSGGGGGGAVLTPPPTSTMGGPAVGDQSGGAALALVLGGLLCLAGGVVSAMPSRRRTRG